MLGCRERKRNTLRSTFIWIVIFLLSLGMFLRLPSKVFAQEKENQEVAALSGSRSSFHDFADELREGFNYVFRTLLFGATQRPNDSTENPNNDFLEIPRYSLELEPRPDFFLDFRKIKLLVKPRLNLKWERWEDGSRSGDTDADSDLFINEWLVSLRLIKDLFASYGRENLQWGPSYLISPSNPFFRDNGLSNPKREVPGMDFARLVWVPGSAWGFSLIANVDKGRQEFISDDFEPTYALKADYITYRKYLSLIASYRENDRGHLGAYAGWTVSNALLLYGEGTVSQGTNALYPVADPAAPFGIRMSPTREDETSLEGVLLLGGSYTLEAGPTLTAEYVFNSEGYTDSEAELCFELRRRASNAFFLPEPIQSLSRSALIQTLDPRLRLLRRNYLMVQYQESQIWNVLSVIFRYIYNFDDKSSRFIPVVEYDIGDHTQLFLIGSQNFGSKDTEFRSVVDYQWTVGLRYTF